MKLVVFLNFIYLSSSSKILILFPSPVFSHFILGDALAKGLANAGHEITMVSAYDKKSSSPYKGKYNNIILTGIEEVFINASLPSWKEVGEYHPIQTELFLMNSKSPGYLITNFTLNHPNFQKLINSNETFDVIILENFMNDALKVLMCHYQIPLISLVTFKANFNSNPLVGNPSPLSYLPDYLLSYSGRMNLWERTMNSLFTLTKYIIRDFIYFPFQTELIKEQFPHCYQNFNKIIYNASLTFINSHESITHSGPFVPSMISIGGFHLNTQKKLPNELQKFMDEAKDGVIYFSLGSNVVPSSISPQAKGAILRVFSELKEKVLWKWDEDEMTEKPNNVLIRKWFSQQEILAHPNTKLFISHGGLLSITETVYYGVPVLCLPIFGDQWMNGAKVESDEYSISIGLKYLSEKNLRGAVMKLLTDSKYRENAKKRSDYLKDRPMNPMDLAIYWTEFVIKHKGAPHFRVTGLDVEWYQYFLLDVVAVVIISVVTVLTAIYYLCKIFLRKLRKTIKLKIN